MCYTGLCKWEVTSGPNAGECTWPGWHTGEKPENAPCPDPDEPERSESFIDTPLSRDEVFDPAVLLDKVTLGR